MGKICVERPYIGVDGHIVVIEDNQQVVPLIVGIIDTLESQSAAYGGVAYNSHYVSTGLVAFERGCHRHSECSRNGIGCMSGRKSIIFALGGRGETAQAAEFSVSVDS